MHRGVRLLSHNTLICDLLWTSVRKRYRRLGCGLLNVVGAGGTGPDGSADGNRKSRRGGAEDTEG